MRFRVGARTDVGRVREGNEDSLLIHEPVFAVADGMGGHQGGEVASKVALSTLEEIADLGDSDPQPPLADVVRRANQDVLQKASEDPGLSGMGTTLTAVFATRDRIHLAHVGDSRAYLLRDDGFQRLTKDHTVVERLVEEGRISEDEAEIHPQRSILTRALGVDDDIQVDETMVQLRPGDRLLLCSDGLTGMVPEDEIHRILSETEDPQESCDALVDAANEAGGQDNITAVVIDVEHGDGAGPVAQARRGPGPAVWQEAGRRWPRRVLVWVVIPLLVIGALLAAGRWYVNQQWFVGVEGDRVAVFRGIPARPLGIDLATRATVTGIRVSSVEPFAQFSAIDEGITADSEEDALRIVEEMHRVLDEAKAQQPSSSPGGGEGK